MQAFHNDPSFKAQLIDMARQHREADDYIAGTYADEDSEKFRGCSVGCTVRDINALRGGTGDYDDHSFLAQQLGVPEFIAHLQDRIFEGLPADQRSGWTERLLSAVPVGADLEPVLPRFLLETQRRNLTWVDQRKFPRAYAAILDVIRLLEEWVDTGVRDVSAAQSAVESALAARAAAESALAAWAASAAAQSAVESASAAAQSAVESALAASAAAQSAERSYACSRMADDLVRLIEEAK